MGKAAERKKEVHRHDPHDFRRSAPRNLSRAEVPETIAMRFTGHLTNSMYRRYRIVSEENMHEVAGMLQRDLAARTKETIVSPIRRSA